MTPAFPPPVLAGSAPASPRPLSPAENVNPVTGVGFVLLAVFLFVMLGRPFDFFLAGLHAPLLLSVLAMLFAFFSGELFRSMSSRPALAMWAFTLWMLPCVVFSVWRGGSVDILSNWIKSFMSFLMIVTLVRTLNQTLWVVRILGLAMLCVGLLSLRFGGRVEGRLVLTEGLYSGPNEIATAAVMAVVAWWAMLSRPGVSAWRRLISGACLLYVLSLLPETGSRGGMVTLGVIFLVLIWSFSPIVRVVALLVGLAGAVGALSIMPAEMRVRYLGMFTSEVDVSTRRESDQFLTAQASSVERMNLFIDSLKVTASHPLLGVGPGMFGVERFNRMTEEGKRRGSYQGTHNTYTQISSETGLPGFLFFMLTIVFSWQSLRHVERLFRPLRDHPEGKQILHLALTLRLLLIGYMVFFVFEHIGYDPFYLTVCALITAFYPIALSIYRRHQALAAAPPGTPSLSLPSFPAVTSPVPEELGFPAPALAASGPRYRLGGRLAPPR